MFVTLVVKFMVSCPQEPETYEKPKLALADIVAGIQATEAVEFDGISYSVQYFLGGDWKFLACNW